MCKCSSENWGVYSSKWAELPEKTFTDKRVAKAYAKYKQAELGLVMGISYNVREYNEPRTYLS